MAEANAAIDAVAAEFCDPSFGGRLELVPLTIVLGNLIADHKRGAAAAAAAAEQPRPSVDGYANTTYLAVAKRYGLGQGWDNAGAAASFVAMVRGTIMVFGQVYVASGPRCASGHGVPVATVCVWPWL